MNEAWSNEDVKKDHFAVAQVALYIFAILQMVIVLMTLTGGIPLGPGPQVSTMQRLSAITSTVVNLLCFAVGYVLLARCLTRCTTLVWRIAISVFLVNSCVTALAIAAQPNPLPVLTCSLSIAGAISVWNGRGVVGRHANKYSVD